MKFANYPAFRTALLTVIDGDDISQSSISVNVLDLIVGAGEQRLYRDVRSSTQDTSFTATIALNVAPLPTDCLELKSVFLPTWPALTYCPYELIQTLIQKQSQSFHHPKRYSLQGDNLIFWPSQPDGTVVSGQYIKRFPDISTGLNAFFTRWPDLFLYAALAESAPYIGEQSRLPEWKERYLTIAQSVNETERRRGTRGSKLQTRIG